MKLIGKPGGPPFGSGIHRLCGAKRKRTGQPRKKAAIANGRCRLHGSLSARPQTKEGRDRQRISAEGQPGWALMVAPRPDKKDQAKPPAGLG